MTRDEAIEWIRRMEWRTCWRYARLMAKEDEIGEAVYIPHSIDTELLRVAQELLARGDAGGLP